MARRFATSLVLALALVPSALRAASWDEPFRATPAELQQACLALESQPGDDVAILLESGRYELDEKGRQAYSHHLVFRVLTDAGVEDWGSMGLDWHPWHEERPELRARVITADGVEHALDPATIDDAPAADDGSEVYSDDRVLQAPLPSVTRGAIVEQLVTVRDREPFFDAASSGSFAFSRSVPIGTCRLVLDAPASLPLTTVVRLPGGLEPRREEAGGRVRLTYQLSPVPRRLPLLSRLPPEVVQLPRISFTSGRSWQAVASRYAEMIEGRIRPEDVRESAVAAAGDATDPLAKARRLLAWAHEKVRYTGIEFGENAIVPVTPAECLKRGYGDCKDQAVLLVALLRAAGVPSDVALLKPGFGEDLHGDAPGLEIFSHAICVTRTEPPIWIDPTWTSYDAGQLPLSDRGRNALIANRETTELVRTPETTAESEKTLETIDVKMAETGKGELVETTEAHGSFAASYRSDYAGETDEKIAEGLKTYAARTYLAKGIDSVSRTSSKDVSTPFRLSFRATEAQRASTGDADAAVLVTGVPALEPLSILLPAERDEKAGEPSKEEKELAAREEARVEDHLLPRAFSWERRYRIVPPPGFVPRELPAGETVKLGPGAWTSAFAAADDGVVTVTYRAEMPARRLTHAQWKEMAAGIKKVRDADHSMVVFDFLPAKLLAAGQVREGFAQCRRLIAQHPAEALHHVQLARLLLWAGLGEGARAETDRAVALDPRSAVAHRQRGLTLQHDPLGRLYGKGASRDEAIAAYRRAKELDLADTLTRSLLAEALEREADGALKYEGPDLAQAIAEFRSLSVDLSHHDLDDEYLAALTRSGDFAAARTLAESMPQSTARDAALVAIAAATQGPDAALALIGRPPLGSANRAAILPSAADSLIRLRRYPEATALLLAATQASSDASALGARARVIERVRRHETVVLEKGDPRSAFRRLLLALVQDDKKLLQDAVVSDLRDVMTDASQQFGASFRTMMTSFGLPPAASMDILVAIVEPFQDGDAATGWRLRWVPATAKESVTIDAYFVMEGDTCRAVALDASELGGQALKHVEAGNVVAARRWLDWAHDRLSGGRPSDAVLAHPPFLAFWHPGTEADADAVRLAAASLLASSSTPEKAIPILEKARAEATADDVRARLDLALCPALVKVGRNEEAMTVARRLLDLRPDDLVAFLNAAAVATATKDPKTVLELCQARLAKRPEESATLRILSEAQTALGQLAEATATLRRVVDRGDGTPGDLNQLAWMGLFTGSPSAPLIEDAQRAVSGSQSKAWPILHTLATCLAEDGRSREARQVLLQSIALRDDPEPAAVDWYVLGRLAENYGENETAAAAYAKVVKLEDNASPIATRRLAEKRLAALGARPAGG